MAGRPLESRVDGHDALHQRLGRRRLRAHAIAVKELMRLLDVDHIESHLFFVLLVQLVERGHLPAEGRSRVTAEDQRHRLPPAER